MRHEYSLAADSFARLAPRQTERSVPVSGEWAGGKPRTAKHACQQLDAGSQADRQR